MTASSPQDPTPQDLATQLFDAAATLLLDPLAIFEAWLAEAGASEPNDPNAMALATVDAQGMPDLRMVLLNGRDARGFVFFTNTESAKGVELAANPRAALLFHWKSLRRQVRIRGPVVPVSVDEADAYFATRHPRSRRGAHASLQSRPLRDRPTLEAALAEVERTFPDDNAIPRPGHWSGYRVIPNSIEFWRDGANRLHDRVVFSRDAAGENWSRVRLYP